MPYVQSGYVQTGYVIDEMATPPPTPGELVGTLIALPAVGELSGMTSFGDPGYVRVIHHQNPGPYSDELLFLLRTPLGQRVFGRKMPSASILTTDIGRYATLLSVTGFGINTVPLGDNLLASIGTVERPGGTVVIDNRSGEWSQWVFNEPILFMPAGLWQHYGGGDVHVQFVGQVDGIEFSGETVTLTIGEP